MGKQESTLPKMVLSLGMITILAATMLGGVYSMTKDVIAQTEEKAKVEAIRAVAPEFDNNPVADKYIYHAHEGTKDSVTVIVYPAKKEGAIVGAAVESVSLKGFGGEIRVMYGFDAEGTIKNYRVLKHAETAGLGAKMQSWFSEKKNSQSVIGLNAEKNDIRVKKDGGEVDGITAATITSRAFLGALTDAYEAYKSEKEAQGAKK